MFHLPLPAGQLKGRQKLAYAHTTGQHDRIESRPVHGPAGKVDLRLRANAEIAAFQQRGHNLPRAEDHSPLVQQPATCNGLKVFQRKRWVGQQLCKPLHFCLIARRLAYIRQLRAGPPGIEITGRKIRINQQPRFRCVSGIEARHHQRKGISACPACRLRGRIKDDGARSRQAEARSHRRPGNACAKDCHPARTFRPGYVTAGKNRFQPLAFAPVAFCLAHIETCLCQPAAHITGYRKGRRPAAGRRAS